MKRFLLLLAFLLCFATKARAQLHVPSFVADPATCDSNRGLQYFNTMTMLMKFCSAPNVWSVFGSVAGTVTTTGSPASGHLAVFTGASTITGNSAWIGTMGEIDCIDPGCILDMSDGASNEVEIDVSNPRIEVRSGNANAIQTPGKTQYSNSTGQTAVIAIDPSAGTSACTVFLPSANPAASQFLRSTAPSGGNCTTSWADSLTSATNCSSSASPAVCGSARAGSVAVPTGATPTLQINTTAVTSLSQILLTIDESLGAKLSATCNTTLSTLVQPVVTARSVATSFTIQINATLAANPACVSYLIVN
jgi:hypothetical protein